MPYPTLSRNISSIIILLLSNRVPHYFTVIESDTVSFRNTFTSSQIGWSPDPTPFLLFLPKSPNPFTLQAGLFPISNQSTS